jgi:hypothetical protein
LPHSMGIVALSELDPKPIAKPSPKGLQVALSHEDLAFGTDPHPLPDRPDVEGALWKSDVDLANLTPQERENCWICLRKHRTMWDGRFGQVHSTAHHIQLNPGSKPAY